MKKQRGEGSAAAAAFPPRSVRLDPELLYQAELLVARNKRDGKEEKTIGRIVNAALREYLAAKKRGTGG